MTVSAVSQSPEPEAVSGVVSHLGDRNPNPSNLFVYRRIAVRTPPDQRIVRRRSEVKSGIQCIARGAEAPCAQAGGDAEAVIVIVTIDRLLAVDEIGLANAAHTLNRKTQCFDEVGFRRRTTVRLDYLKVRPRHSLHDLRMLHALC